MYAPIVLSSYLSSSLNGTTLTLPAFGLFIRRRMSNWPGRNTITDRSFFLALILLSLHLISPVFEMSRLASFRFPVNAQVLT